MSDLKKRLQLINKKHSRLELKLGLDSQKLRTRMNRNHEEKAKEFFGDYTLEQLTEHWNKADESLRSDILEMNPNINYHFNKLDSYGGLRYGEIYDQVIREDFGDSEWLDFETITNCFGEYLKESKT